MAMKALISFEGKNKLEKKIRILGFALLAFLLVTAGNIACKKEAEEVASEEEGAAIEEEGLIRFEGAVKVAVGKYVFIPEAQGFDVVVQGDVDTSILADKEVRGEGAFSPENPSILVADSIDVKEAGEDWRNVFTRTEEVVLEDYLDLKAREEFQVLEELSYDKKKGWEEIDKAKVYGKLEKKAVTEEEEQKDIYTIIITDDNGNVTGRIIIDGFTDFAQYYINKLRLFNKFWFYVNIKDTVDWQVRRRTRELFHADVLFTGLF